MSMLLFMVGPLSFSQIFSVISPFLSSPSGENLGEQLSLKYLEVKIHTNFIDRPFAKPFLGGACHTCHSVPAFASKCLSWEPD